MKYYVKGDRQLASLRTNFADGGSYNTMMQRRTVGLEAHSSWPPTGSTQDWYHLAWVNNPDELNIYVNGENVDTLPSAVIPESQPGTTALHTPAMWDSSNTGCFSNMRVDDVRVFDEALSAADMRREAARPGSGAQCRSLQWNAADCDGSGVC